MSDTPAMDIVVSGGPEPDPDRPARDPRDQNRLLLQLIAVGVFLVLLGVCFTGWTQYQTQRDSRLLNCLYVADFGGVGEDRPAFEDLPKSMQRVIDRFGCSYPGR